MPYALKSGEWSSDPRLDRCKEVDLRSLNYLVSDLFTAEHTAPRSYTWNLNEWFDQGQEGACVGFGFSHELAARPGVVTGVDNDWARNLYWDVQKGDPWPGGAYPGASPKYEGTSVLTGAKVVKDKGFYQEYRWALNVSDFAIAVSYFGPGVIGIDWYSNMFEPDKEGFVHPTGQIAGGHCICVVGVKVVRNADGSVDPLRSYFILHNSWGPDWGIHGRCYVTFTEMAVLWPGGDFCIPIHREKATV